MKCDKCRRRMIVGGAAMTDWICGHCFTKHTAGSTYTPIICRECSSQFKRCEQCLQELNVPICGCGNTKEMCKCVNGFGHCLQLQSDNTFKEIPMKRSE